MVDIQALQVVLECSQHFIQLFYQRGKVVCDDCPQNIKAHLVIPMNQSVSKANDIFPGD